MLSVVVYDIPAISIHAPAKGATSFCIVSRSTPSFQSTLPRRERLCPRESFRHWTYFNPRSREGSDILPKTRWRNTDISIHAPAKGATASAEHHGKIMPHFNPRSREGSDATGVNQVYKQAKFQSTLPRRERRARYLSSLSPADFNPRSREGSDNLPARLCAVKEISIHAPAKGATDIHRQPQAA